MMWNRSLAALAAGLWIAVAALAAAAVPTAPALIAPQGAITTATPTYTWNASADATSYYLLVQNTAGVAIGTSYSPAAAGCVSGTGTCSVTPATGLTSGASYNWFVNASSGAGTSAWSAPNTITINASGPPLPASPTLISPTGTITTATPAYSWSAYVGATSYYLLVQNTAGVAIGTSYSASAAGCAATPICTVAPSVALTNGAAYNWFVSATNVVGTSAWSSPSTITVNVAAGPSAPATPSPVSPSGPTTTTTPTYTWSAAAGATSYRLQVMGMEGLAVMRVYAAWEAGCPWGTGTCSVTPPTALTSGSSYNWSVSAANIWGASPFSAATAIAVSGTASAIPAAPTPVAPFGPIYNTLATYVWNASAGATSYNLRVLSPTGTILNRIYTAGDVGCSSGVGTCSATPPEAVTFGSIPYTWSATAGNSAGTSAFGPAAAFTGTSFGFLVPGTPTPVGPSGAVTTTTPTFSWSTPLTSNDTLFNLRVQGSLGIAADLFFTYSEAACSGSTSALTCSVTPTVALAAGGSYTWSVGESSGAGTSPFSAPVAFTVNASGPSPPAAPTTVTPSGSITTTTPTFAWNASTGATSYTLQVQTSAGLVVNQAYTAAQAGCHGGAGMCAVTSPTALFAGSSYDWLVTASNGAGTSAASASRAFSVAGAGLTVPAAPTLVSPAGMVSDTATEPHFIWNASAAATSYYLLVQNTGGVAIGISYTAAEAGCAAGTGTCHATPATGLTAGASYNWFVNATNAAGTSAWSAPFTITVSGTLPAPPAAPTLVSPTGTITTTTPTYTWNAAAGATSYYLLVQNTAGVAVGTTYGAAAAGCAAGTGTCAATPATALTNGASYNWFVNATNALGTSDWSAPRTITVNATVPTAPNAPILGSPLGNISTATPVYSWNASAGATSYYLLVQNTAGVAIGTSYSATSLGCGSGIGLCSVMPSTTLASGSTYNWFVSASSNAGTSPWSGANTITVNVIGPSPPAPPTPVSPTGSVTTTTTPTYIWNASTGATSYYLLVQNTGGVAVGATFSAAAAGCSGGGICEVTPATALMNGASYNWFVNATNANGTSEWSAARAITLNVGGPAAPTVVSPYGNIAAATPRYTWNASPGAISYNLQVRNTAGVAIDATYSAATAGCESGGTCSVLPATALAEAITYNWSVNASHSLGTSDRSAARSFIVRDPDCPVPPADVLDFPLKLSGADRLQMVSGRIASAILPKVSDTRSSSSGQIIFGEATISPRAATVEISVTKCRGAIDTNGGLCYARLSNGSFMKLEWIERAIWGANTDVIANTYGLCKAYQTEGEFFVNVRYTYSPADCTWGGQCGYTNQWNYAGY